MACNVHKGFLFSLFCPRLLCDLIHLETSSLSLKDTKKKRCSYFLLQLCPTFPAFLQSVLNDSLSCSDSHPVTSMRTHVNKLTHFRIKRSEMLKCLWSLEFQRRSEEIPEQIFHHNPQREGEDSLIDIYFPTDEYYNRWILFLHLYISINKPWITSEPLFPVVTSLAIMTKPARWSFLTVSLKEQTEYNCCSMLSLDLSVIPGRCDLAPNSGINDLLWWWLYCSLLILDVQRITLWKLLVNINHIFTKYRERGKWPNCVCDNSDLSFSSCSWAHKLRLRWIFYKICSHSRGKN